MAFSGFYLQTIKVQHYSGEAADISLDPRVSEPLLYLTAILFRITDNSSVLSHSRRLKETSRLDAEKVKSLSLDLQRKEDDSSDLREKLADYKKQIQQVQKEVHETSPSLKMDKL